MRKSLLFVVCLAMTLACAFCVAGCFSSDPSENLEMVLNHDMTFSVKSIGLCGDTDIVIPETYNGAPVVGISENAFAGYGINSVVIPKSIKTVGANAFYGCDKLTKVDIKSQDILIGNRAFGGCSALEEVVVLKGANYGAEVFFDSGVKKVTFEKGVTRVDDGLFSSARALKEIVFNDEIVEIGDQAFFNSGIEELYLPQTLTTIGESAFQQSKLKGIVIPTSTVNVGSYVFADCAYLEYVTLDASNVPSSWSSSWNRGYTGDLIDVEVLFNGHVHDKEIVNQKAATCLTTGYINYKCKTCNQETTVALPKDKQSHVSNEGDWRSDPNEHWKQCIYCTVRYDHGEHTMENGKCTVCGRT